MSEREYQIPETERRALRAELRRLMDAQSWTEKQAGDAIGVTQQMISKAERLDMGLPFRERLLAYLGLTKETVLLRQYSAADLADRTDVERAAARAMRKMKRKQTPPTGLRAVVPSTPPATPPTSGTKRSRS